MTKHILKINDLRISYGEKEVLHGVSLSTEPYKLTTLMGPSGCGKTTLIRAINRLHELTPGVRVQGEILLSGNNIFKENPILLRQRIGMVFQRPNPFPNMSIFQNVLAGFTLTNRKLKKKEQEEIVENALKQAALWDEVKDNLHKKGSFLSGGQQQRLCVARALAVKPEILLLDEPTSALDPGATSKIEELLSELKKNITILMVTHNIAQAARVSDYTAFLYLGDLVEFGTTEKLFTVPDDPKTEEYLSGKFG